MVTGTFNQQYPVSAGRFNILCNQSQIEMPIIRNERAGRCSPVQRIVNASWVCPLKIESIGDHAMGGRSLHVILHIKDCVIEAASPPHHRHCPIPATDKQCEQAHVHFLVHKCQVY